MTPQSTNADEPSKSPIPELNPMLNPLLSQNMGRWAEVYFTHSPEEREQAVQELVRQLEQENKERELQHPKSSSLKQTEPSEAAGRSSTEQKVMCPGCGHESPASQRFCGACGIPIAKPAGPGLQRIPATAAITAAPGTLGEESWEESEAAENQAPEDMQHYFLEERPRENGSDIEPPMFGSAEPSFSHSYRILLGLALAIVLGVLGYMAWHKGQNQSQDSPQAAAVAADQATLQDRGSNKTEQASNRPATASAAKAEDPSTKAESASKEAPPSNPATTAAAATPTTPEPTPITDEAAPTKKAALTGAAKTERIQQNGNGAEELAMAQRYLNVRDPAQAAQWLWKSVAKQNSQATLMLADLYLRGEGVQKNCDQARILLDAAARKGQTGAATRLRNLQAFGCQ